MAITWTDDNHNISRHQNIGINDDEEDILGCCIVIIGGKSHHKSLIPAILSQDGFSNIHFIDAGPTLLQKTLELMPDMIILNMLMSQGDGLEICAALRDIDHFRNIAIIAHTPEYSPDDRARIYDAGATDIFPEPVSGREVRNRVHMYLKYRQGVRGLKEYHERLARDLDIARSMQEAILPPVSRLDQISQSHGLEIASQYEASEELGGDFWGIDVLDADRLFIYVIDFSGHGLSASLNVFRLHSLMWNDQNSDFDRITSPASYLEKLNRALFKLLPLEQYATMLCGIIDVKKNIFTYAAAASTAPVKLSPRSRDVISLDPSGFPLGMIGDATYDDREIAFARGEMLFFYSDALIESLDQEGRMIGESHFREICRTSNADSAKGQSFLETFMKNFNGHVTRPLCDDLTAITITRP